MNIHCISVLMTGTALMLPTQTWSQYVPRPSDLSLPAELSAAIENKSLTPVTSGETCSNELHKNLASGLADNVRNYNRHDLQHDPTLVHSYNRIAYGGNQMSEAWIWTGPSSNDGNKVSPDTNTGNEDVVIKQNTFIKSEFAANPQSLPSTNKHSAGRSYLNGFFTDDLPGGDAITPKLMGYPWDYTINYSYQDHWAGAGISGLKVSKFGAYPIIVGVFHVDTGYKNFTAAAKGTYNAYYKTTAQSLRPYAHYIYAVRIDHEFNGDWYHWSPFGGAGQVIDAPTWIAGWRNMAKAIRAALPNAKIIWNPNIGNNNPYPYYPGDDLVDIIGLDLYNQPISYKTSVLGWDDFLSGSGGNNLTALSTFGRQHSKPLSFPEWGDSFGDGYFISMFSAWMDVNNVVAQTYWDSGQGLSSTSSLMKLPKNQAAYVSAFGHRPYTGTFWRKISIPP